MTEYEWLSAVAEPELGVLAARSDWHEWLHELFVSRGAASGPELLRLAFAVQREVAEGASRRVAADVAHTTGTVVAIELATWDRTMRITCDGKTRDGDTGFVAIGREEAACEVADTVQDVLQERSWKVWPTCAAHDSGLHPDLINGEAVWLCRRGKHHTPIGALGDEAGRL